MEKLRIVAALLMTSGALLGCNRIDGPSPKRQPGQIGYAGAAPSPNPNTEPTLTPTLRPTPPRPLAPGNSVKPRLSNPIPPTEIIPTTEPTKISVSTDPQTRATRIQIFYNSPD